MCHDAPKASLKTHRMREGIRGRRALSPGLPLSSDRHVECWMHINLCPISEFTLRAGEPPLFFLSFLSPPFSYSRGASATSGQAFPFDITYVLTIPRLLSPASQVNRFYGFLERKYRLNLRAYRYTPISTSFHDSRRRK